MRAGLTGVLFSLLFVFSFSFFPPPARAPLTGADSSSEEPKLRYRRLGGSVPDILGKDVASCMAVSSKVLAAAPNVADSILRTVIRFWSCCCSPGSVVAEISSMRRDRMSARGAACSL